jgi:hypothetical protein
MSSRMVAFGSPFAQSRSPMSQSKGLTNYGSLGSVNNKGANDLDELLLPSTGMPALSLAPLLSPGRADSNADRDIKKGVLLRAKSRVLVDLLPHLMTRCPVSHCACCRWPILSGGTRW